jgi:pyrimidine deaminase RibD-like protein
VVARIAGVDGRRALLHKTFTPPERQWMDAKAHFMAAALEESRLALPACRPNPPVGSVIVRGDTIIARGFTGRPGEHHAEAAALAGVPAGLDPAELTLFVTLEPCSFVRRTPSCALTLVSFGIRRVIVGTIDPHPRNRGRGLEILRDAGVHVELGVLEHEVLTFIEPYLIRTDDDAEVRQGIPHSH